MQQQADAGAARRASRRSRWLRALRRQIGELPAQVGDEARAGLVLPHGGVTLVHRARLLVDLGFQAPLRALA